MCGMKPKTSSSTGVHQPVCPAVKTLCCYLVTNRLWL